MHDVHEFDSAASGSNLFPTIMNFCGSILSQRKSSSGRFLVSLCGLLLLLAASDANRGSGGGREGHLRAAVVVQVAGACAADHPSVRVRSSVRVSVPEAPDVALWADRGSRDESGILDVRSPRKHPPLLQTTPTIRTPRRKGNDSHFWAAVGFCLFCWLLGNTD